MLIALDQAEQLEQDLRKWIREEDYAAPLQLMLSRLLAEQGKIEDAKLTVKDLKALSLVFYQREVPCDYKTRKPEILESVKEVYESNPSILLEYNESQSMEMPDFSGKYQ